MKLLDKYGEAVANNEKVNKGIIYGSIIVQGICTFLLVSCAYFGGVRKGVDITDSYYGEREEKEDEQNS